MSGCLGVIAVLLIIAGLMDMNRPGIGIPIIGVGVGILVIISSSSKKRRERITNSSGSTSRSPIDSQGRFYCNACGGYVTQHHPSNHPECN